MIKIACPTHKDEEIKILDMSKQPKRQTRLYCLECLNNSELQATLQISKAQGRAQEYIDKKTKEIMEEYDPQLSILKKALDQLNTLKLKIVQNLDQQIKQLDTLLKELQNMKKKEFDSYNNIIKEITTPKKLEELVQIILQNKERVQKLPELRDKMSSTHGELIQNLNQAILDLQKGIEEQNQSIYGKPILKSELKLNDVCWSLICQQVVVGGIGNDIIIWKQDQFKLIEQQQLKGHTDIVTSLVMYKSGDKLVSGGGKDDQTLKLWKKQQNQWECAQTLNDHKDRINDIKLTQKEDYLISASDDQLIKIWQLGKQSNLLECLQTLNDHNNCVYWITLATNGIYMVSSSFENYFNIFKFEQNQICKKVKKFDTQGQIHRICFIDNSYLVCQQVVPPKLIIYVKGYQDDFSVTQEIVLNQADNNNILFPMVKMGTGLYCKNEKVLYKIRQLNTGKFYIEQIQSGWFRSGCVDTSGQCLILGNQNNNQIEIYG